MGYWRERSRLKHAKLVCAKLGAMKLGDGVAESFERATDLPVAAFVHRYAPLFIIVTEPFKLQFAQAIFELQAMITDHLPVQGL